MEQGKVDGERLCIMGRSAGGYTTLACLALKDTFKAGASLYGVSYHPMKPFNKSKFYLQKCLPTFLFGKDACFLFHVTVIMKKKQRKLHYCAFSIIFRFTNSSHFTKKQVADLSLLRAETHKFESRYLDNLVGMQ